MEQKPTTVITLHSKPLNFDRTGCSESIKLNNGKTYELEYTYEKCI